jgi:hypothetical protein
LGRSESARQRNDAGIIQFRQKIISEIFEKIDEEF